MFIYSRMKKAIIPTHKTSYKPHPCFLDIPLELLERILDHLDLGSSVAFTLSCKVLYQSFFRDELGQLHQLPEEQQVECLEPWLEKSSIARSFYCHCCEQFHQYSTHLRPTDRNLSDKLCIDGGPLPRRDGVALCELGFEPNMSRPRHSPKFLTCYAVSWPIARLVMNGHLFGSQCGLPLSCLQVRDIRVEWPRELGYKWTHSWQARIIGNELFLSAVHIFSARGIVMVDPNAKIFGPEGTHFSPAICRHCEAFPQMKIPVEKEDSRYEDVRKFDKIQGACEWCLTDWFFSITLRPPNNSDWKSVSWSITLTTYHRLGSCRDPND